MMPKSYNTNTPKVFDIVNGNTMTKMQDRAFELGSWVEMREWFEDEIGRKIKWEPAPNMQLVVDNSEKAKAIM